MLAVPRSEHGLTTRGHKKLAARHQESLAAATASESLIAHIRDHVREYVASDGAKVL
jgi:hypothetical protein